MWEGDRDSFVAIIFFKSATFDVILRTALTHALKHKLG